MLPTSRIAKKKVKIQNYVLGLAVNVPLSPCMGGGSCSLRLPALTLVKITSYYLVKRPSVWFARRFLTVRFRFCIWGGKALSRG